MHKHTHTFSLTLQTQMPARPWCEVELSIDEQIQRCPLAKLAPTLPLAAGNTTTPEAASCPKVAAAKAKARRDGRLHESDVFEWVEKSPIAAASIAQVHMAKLSSTVQQSLGGASSW